MENKRDLKQGSKILIVGIVLVGLVVLMLSIGLLAQAGGGGGGGNEENNQTQPSARLNKEGFINNNVCIIKTFV